MKKIFLLLFASILVLGACKNNDSKNDEPAPPVDNESYEITLSSIVKILASGDFTVDVECEGAWKVSCNKGWVSLDKTGGTGDAVVKVTVEAGDPDEAEITFTSGEYSATLTVIRNSGDTSYITISPSTIWKRGEGSNTVIVSASSSWTALRDKSWLTISPTSGGSGETTVSLSWPNGADDVATVTFTSGSLSKQLTVTRKRRSEDTPEPSEDPSEDVPEGALKSKFKVSADEYVYFSKGNLQYQSLTKKWQFADVQYQYKGLDNEHISDFTSYWIDLYGWGTSGWQNEAVCYQPWSTSTDPKDYHPGANEYSHLLFSYQEADWGYHNYISNGGNWIHQWRTPTKSEWEYLFSHHTHGQGTVNGVHGYIILPEGWTTPSGLSQFVSVPNNWTSNNYDINQWSAMERKGALFLPCTGVRFGTDVSQINESGYYWSAASVNTNMAYCMYFKKTETNPALPSVRHAGLAVRLIKDVR